MCPEHGGHVGNRDVDGLLVASFDRRQHVQIDLAPPPEAALHVLDRQRRPRVHVHLHHGNGHHQVEFQHVRADLETVDRAALGDGQLHEVAPIHVDQGAVPPQRGRRDPRRFERLVHVHAQDRAFSDRHLRPRLAEDVDHRGDDVRVGRDA